MKKPPISEERKAARIKFEDARRNKTENGPIALKTPGIRVIPWDVKTLHRSKYNPNVNRNQTFDYSQLDKQMEREAWAKENGFYNAYSKEATTAHKLTFGEADET